MIKVPIKGEETKLQLEYFFSSSRIKNDFEFLKRGKNVCSIPINIPAEPSTNLELNNP